MYVSSMYCGHYCTPVRQSSKSFLDNTISISRFYKDSVFSKNQGKLLENYCPQLHIQFLHCTSSLENPPPFPILVRQAMLCRKHLKRNTIRSNPSHTSSVGTSTLRWERCCKRNLREDRKGTRYCIVVPCF